MRPDAKHQRSQRQERARTRTYAILHLHWLYGFPVSQNGLVVRWCAIEHESGDLHTLVVDRELLRRAVFAVNKLAANASMLAELVDDPAWWLKHIRVLLEQLKQAVHRGTALPASPPGYLEELPARSRPARANILRQQPHLQPIADALAWGTYLQADASSSVITWLAKHSDQLTTLLSNEEWSAKGQGVPWAYRFWQLAERHGEPHATRLLCLAVDRDIACLPHVQREHHEYCQEWTMYLGHLQGRKPSSPWPTPPTSLLGTVIREVVTTIVNQPVDTQAALLATVEHLIDDDLIRAFAQQAEAIAEAVAMGTTMAMAPRGTQFSPQQWTTCTALFNSATPSEFPHSSLSELPKKLLVLARPEHEAIREELPRVLSMLPVRAGKDRVPEALFMALVSRLEYSSPQAMTTAITAFGTFLRRIPSEQRDLPWLSDTRSLLLVVLGLGSQSAKKRQAIYDAWRQLWPMVSGHIDLDLLDLLGDLHARPTTIVQRYAAAQDAGLVNRQINFSQLRCAELLHSCGANYGACLTHLFPHGYDAVNNIHRAAAMLMADQHSEAVRILVEQNQFTELANVGGKLALFGSVGSKSPTMHRRGVEPAPWWQRYPTTLHDSLLRLSTLTDRAERIAQRVLHKEFPEWATLQSEIAELEKRLATTPDVVPMQRRLANLRQRLVNPKPISALRMNNLSQQLELAGARAALNEGIANVLVYWQQRVRTLLQIEELPSWFSEPRNLRLVGAVDQLREPFRELGLKLLRRRCGPPPWNFQAEAANQAFLAMLRQRGIDPQPWEQPALEEWITNEKGERLHMTIERDPLEVLRMGEPFDTCLSPDGCNFFSTVANAIDINKRVIYVRNSRGQIVARRLLALTEHGAMLTFRLYVNGDDGIITHVMTRMIQQLADQMKTAVVKRGRVPHLVATEWYDDGSVDVCDRFFFLADGSAFRASLMEIPLTDLLPILQSLCDPLPVNEMILGLILELPEFNARPELILPLLPLLETAHLADSTRWLAAGYAHRAGRTDDAEKVLNHHSLPAIVRSIRQHGLCHCCSMRAIQLLQERAPTLVLRALRMTRPFGVRNDEGEYDRLRREVLLAVHQRLGRINVVKRLTARYAC